MAAALERDGLLTSRRPHRRGAEPSTHSQAPASLETLQTVSVLQAVHILSRGQDSGKWEGQGPVQSFVLGQLGTSRQLMALPSVVESSQHFVL